MDGDKDGRQYDQRGDAMDPEDDPQGDPLGDPRDDPQDVAEKRPVTPIRVEQGMAVANPFPSAREDRVHARLDMETPQTESPAYRLSYEDPEFLMRDELRGARLQLEFLKPDILMRDRGIVATVVMFGSARIPAPEEAGELLAAAESLAAAHPDDAEATWRLRAMRNLVKKAGYYDEARRLAQMICGVVNEHCSEDACLIKHGVGSVVVVTGGGPGIMEAANRGAHDIGVDNIGLNIVLPFEQMPNVYITPHLNFNFHYFAIRKMHFLLRAVALVVFPGGYGTMDELFEVLTLIQTKKIKSMPVLLFGREYWERMINFRGMAEEGVIAPSDLDIFEYVDTADEAWEILSPVIRALKDQAGDLTYPPA